MENDYWTKVLDRLLSITLFFSKSNLAFVFFGQIKDDILLNYDLKDLL